MWHRLQLASAFQLPTLILLSMFPQSQSVEANHRFDGAVEQNMFRLLNKDRVKRDLPALKWNQRLQSAARKHSERLAQAQQLSHKFADEPELMPRLGDAGARFNAAAENLAYSSEEEDLHPALMRSPGHRANILSLKYNAVGIGVVRVDGKFFATEDFAAAIEETNAADAEKRFIAAANRMRRERKLPPLAIEPDPGISDSLCRMATQDKVIAANVYRPAGTSGVVAFTAPEPEQVPAQILELSPASSKQKIFVGSCFRVSPNYPGGIYWFGVAY